jgi:hypothetical protein
MAGTHGFDMINRIKQNRDLLKAKKERKTLKGFALTYEKHSNLQSKEYKNEIAIQNFKTLISIIITVSLFILILILIL